MGVINIAADHQMFRTLTGIDELARTIEPQTFYGEFYAFAIGLLDTFYPERTVTVTSRDPSYVMPEIKVKLRRKNRLMRAKVHASRAS